MPSPFCQNRSIKKINLLRTPQLHLLFFYPCFEFLIAHTLYIFLPFGNYLQVLGAWKISLHSPRMPTTVQSGRLYTSLETDNEILPKNIEDRRNSLTDTGFFSEFYLDNTDPKASEYASYIFFSLYTVTTVVLSFIKITNLIMIPWKLLFSARKS